MRAKTPSTAPRMRAGYAHRKTFQNQHAHDLFSRGADGAENGKLPPPFAHVHQKGVEDHENGQHDIQPERRKPGPARRFSACPATSACAPKACGFASPAGNKAASSRLHFIFIHAVFQNDARSIDAAGFRVIIRCGSFKRQKDYAALVEIRCSARSEQARRL